MAKVLIGADLGGYSFDKVAKTVTFSGFKPTIEEILLITDINNGTIIYQFNDSTKGGTLSGQVLTLTYNTNTASFNNTDSLQIFYWSEYPQAVSIQELSILFRQLIATVQNPNYASKSKNLLNVSIVDGMLPIVNTVNTVDTTNRILYFGNSSNASSLVSSQNQAAWTTSVRNRIT